MSRKNQPGQPPQFLWGKALRNAAVKGTETGAISAGTAAVTVPEPVTIATVGAVGFAGGALFALAGEFMNHWTDDPAPVFDFRTTLLFDTTGLVLSFLLFVIPALQLDHAMNPGAALPGWFGYMALFLSSFLVTVLRGLLCNLGLAREEDERKRHGV